MADFRIPQLNTLLSEVEAKRPLLSEPEKSLLKKAYEFAGKAHSEQKRKSGEPYFTHSFETAMQLANWNLDIPTIAAGLIHDVVEDTRFTLNDVKDLFGEEVAFLVNGVTKLGKLKYREGKDKNSKEDYRAENIRKMILATSEDLRVVFIKLADRLHNMKTLAALPPAKQKRISLETTEIYASLAYRLGMQNLAGELEDLAFPFIHPQGYKWLKENTRARYEKGLRHLEKVKQTLEENFQKNGIKWTKIDYRLKRMSSLYKKLLRHDMNLDQIYDLVAMRIIVNTVEDCYAALGTIHQLWPPLPGKIKDYIALPKPNGYRSLHTTVICMDQMVTEFQIRTAQMHEEAENGIAAHWAYSQAKTNKEFIKEKKTIFADTQEIKWVQQLRSWQDSFTNPQDFLQSLKVDFFKDRVFAITPKGEVIDLPAGSTPIDFAYHIHTTIGDQCVGAKINNRLVPLDCEIQSGDVVEILTQKNKKPSGSWLQFVKSSNSKRRIRSSLKKSQSLFLKKSQQTELKIIVRDKVGLLKDILNVISRSHINVSNVNAASKASLPTIKLVCDINEKERAEKLILKLKGLEGVKEISYHFL